MKKLSRQTIAFAQPPGISAYAAVVGKKEGEGPLGDQFDRVCMDTRMGQKSWELAESTLQKAAMNLALQKAGLPPEACDFILGGDLLNQCISTAFAVRDTHIPFLGLYGACSTMAESMLVGACLLDGGFADHILAGASSHFCSAERQYRFPLSYGGQRTPTAQWTATAAGSVLLANEKKCPIRITHATCGKIVDMGVKDAANMGGAMAPAAYDTLTALWQDTNTEPADYDLIVTGDLGHIGSEMLTLLLKHDGIHLTHYNDCGRMLFQTQQDTHAGASGCGCSAAVLCGPILRQMEQGKLKRVIFAATGALMSPTSVQQGQSISGICHALVLQRGDN